MTSKIVWGPVDEERLMMNSHEPSKVEEGLDTTLNDLGLEYLDLFLMHWPVASIQGSNKIYYLEVSQPRILPPK